MKGARDDSFYDPTGFLGRPAVWSRLARCPSLRDWAGRGGRRPPVPTPLTVSLCHRVRSAHSVASGRSCGWTPC
eukprot:5135004-Pleurochrysis_carterae.AAC.2